MAALVLTEGATFAPPGAESFELPPLFGFVTKPMLLVVLSVIIIAGYFLLATRKLKVVPGKGQFVAESIYDFARNNIAREQIGSKDFKRYVPVIFALFTFILLNNLYGVIPFLQFPTMARFGFPIALSVLVVYPMYHYAGIKKHGLGGYFKKELAPAGVPRPVLPLFAVIEFAEKFFLNPLTLAIRVFAAMFAGHLILAVFTLGGTFLLTETSSIALKPVSLVAWIFAIGLTFLEAFIQVLQAYIFALLSAGYIGAALASEH
ncbi:F0F1 ATP synthase subunit A [Amycolatopsis benzoatilytica]|uniref:F0F1 ATP synthase subunit A n=1 Tax=Amycolatopsis benzoatilytica TaxID=346045 RepID=UPI00036A0A53|nr:F0F1 ATP synthase subunit A [Amycolatopsis benzoatilytica]